jgi:spore coat protein U-like protein
LLAATAVAAMLAGGHAPILAQGTASTNLNVTATVTRNCTITTVPVAFGTYDAMAGAALDRDGAVKLTCTKGTPATIALGPGGNSQAGQRNMAGGTPAGLLKYELFSDSGRAQVWGDTGGNTFAPPIAPDNLERSFTVYGRILAGQQAVPQGGYSDIVLATVNF